MNWFTYSSLVAALETALAVSTVWTSLPVPKNLSKSRPKDLETLDNIIDDSYYDRFNKPIQNAESTSIELPKIEETNREAMIAPELQNLDL